MQPKHNYYQLKYKRANNRVQETDTSKHFLNKDSCFAFIEVHLFVYLNTFNCHISYHEKRECNHDYDYDFMTFYGWDQEDDV